MLYTNSGNSQAGGVDKEVDYTAFRTYVKQGYAREVVVNKTDGNVRFVVRPEHIRDVFNMGSDKTGTAPTVSAKYPNVDAVGTFLDNNYKVGCAMRRVAISFQTCSAAYSPYCCWCSSISF